MSHQTEHESTDAQSRKALLATLALIVCGLIITALLTDPIQSATPATLWTTDACPEPEQICGQPAVGYLLAAAGGAILTSTIFFSGVLFERLRDE